MIFYALYYATDGWVGSPMQRPQLRGRYSSSWGDPHLRATGRHLPYMPPDTSEHAPPNPRHAGWYSIYLPRRDGRLSWPSWLDSAPAGSRTSDLSITSPTPNRCTTKSTSSLHGINSFNWNTIRTFLIRWRWRAYAENAGRIWKTDDIVNGQRFMESQRLQINLNQ